jgi:hypothetical protein
MVKVRRWAEMDAGANRDGIVMKKGGIMFVMRPSG